MPGLGQENVALRPDLRLQGHHDRLAQRIDRRVCHLRELLAEIVVERAHLVRQHRHGRVVAHRAHRLVLILRQHADDVVALLLGDVEHLLIERERVAIHRLRRQPRVHQITLQVAHPGAQPRLVRVTGFQHLVDVGGTHEGAGSEVERQHVARAELALLHDVFGLVIPHTGFGSDGEEPVARDTKARRAQAVAIERAQSVAAVREYDASGPVPRLHVYRVVLVERAQVRIQRIQSMPRGWDQQPHGMQGIQPPHEQHLEHVVEALRIGAGGGYQRQHFLQLRQEWRT